MSTLTQQEDFTKIDKLRQNKFTWPKREKTVWLIGPINPYIPSGFKNKFFLFIDGGAKIYPLLPLNKRTLLMGDGDSLSHKNQSLKNHFHFLFSKNKNFTDLEGALNILPKNLKNLHCIGFLGGKREDFQLLQFHLLEKFALQKKTLRHISLYSSKKKLGWLLLTPGTHLINFTGNFSVLTSKTQQINLVGKLAYPGKVKILSWSGIGINNESKSNSFTITCEKNLWIHFHESSRQCPKYVRTLVK